MHSACRVIAFCCLILPAGFSQTARPTAAQLEALEKFAGKPTAHIVWSKEVTQIDAGEGHSVITALIVEDTTQTPRQMRGVRIDLNSEPNKDRVYTSEEHLDRLIKALEEISAGLPRFLESSRLSARSCFGSGIFWQQEGHALNASACQFGDWFGLAVTAGGQPTYRFRGCIRQYLPLRLPAPAMS